MEKSGIYPVLFEFFLEKLIRLRVFKFCFLYIIFQLNDQQSGKAMKALNVFFLVLLLSLVSCSSSKDSDKDTRNLKGRIFVVGNSPFTHLALQVDSVTTYLLNCNEEIRKSLSEYQGNFAEITYRDTEETPDGKALKVISATLLPKKE